MAGPMAKLGRRLLPLVLLLLAGCASPGGMPGGTLPPPDMTIVSPKEPPPAKAEAVPPPPAPAPANYFVWDPGHRHWTGQEYVWIPGRYVETPYKHALWVHGGWTYNGDLTWTWTPGHWS